MKRSRALHSSKWQKVFEVRFFEEHSICWTAGCTQQQMECFLMPKGVLRKECTSEFKKPAGEAVREETRGLRSGGTIRRSAQAGAGPGANRSDRRAGDARVCQRAAHTGKAGTAKRGRADRRPGRTRKRGRGRRKADTAACSAVYEKLIS